MDLSALSNATTTVTSLSNLILVSPQAVKGYQPKNLDPKSSITPPPALLFNYEGDQRVMLASDITDHFVEDNTSLQDQISLRPERVQTKGFIGELNNVTPYGFQTAKAAADKLVAIGSYLPSLSATALIAYNVALQAYQTGLNAFESGTATYASLANNVAGGSNGGVSVIGASGIVTPVQNQNQQQKYFQLFYGYWRERRLFTVQTPFAVFDNMAIESLNAVQEADTVSTSSFEVTFKMVRTASTTLKAGVTSARLTAQSSALVDNGSNVPANSIGLSDGLTANYPGLGVSY